MQNLKQNLEHVMRSIADGAQQYHRASGAVKLLAVSKRHPAEAIAQLYQLGQREFAENQLQEALHKIEELKHLPEIEWHFIGSIQSNKTSDIANNFSWVHSVDRLKIAQRLNEQRAKDLPPLNVFIQVNIDHESQKSGVLPEQALDLAKAVEQLPQLKLQGLMALPKVSTDFHEQRKAFAKLRHVQEQLNQQGLALDQLSMGMSNDFEAAVAEGSSWVRIGTALFGSRR